MVQGPQPNSQSPNTGRNDQETWNNAATAFSFLASAVALGTSLVLFSPPREPGKENPAGGGQGLGARPAGDVQYVSTAIEIQRALERFKQQSGIEKGPKAPSGGQTAQEVQQLLEKLPHPVTMKHGPGFLEFSIPTFHGIFNAELGKVIWHYDQDGSTTVTRSFPISSRVQNTEQTFHLPSNSAVAPTAFQSAYAGDQVLSLSAEQIKKICDSSPGTELNWDSLLK